MTIEAIAIGVFLFVALSVGACRTVDAMRRGKRIDAARLGRVTRVHYSGPVYTAHGREIEE